MKYKREYEAEVVNTFKTKMRKYRKELLAIQERGMYAFISGGVTR